MLALGGIALVFLAVFGGYLLEHGNPYVLLQPSEILIVVGAALGITLVSNRPAAIRKMCNGALAVFRAPVYTSAHFLRYLRMLYEVFAFVQRAGIAELESDVENPERSRIFSRYPEFLRDKTVRPFLCDT